jgi:HlyD family secretion protein
MAFMRKRLLWIALVVVLGGVALRFTLLRPDAIPVRVARVEPARVESTITNSKAGTVRARRRANLSAEVGGRVVAIAHREGDAVEEGELLVQLNDATPRAQLLLARLGLRVAQSAANEACIARDRAVRELRRKRSLADQNIVSEDLLDGLQSASEAAEASCNARGSQVGEAQAQITVMEAELAKYSIRAPFAGVIAEQEVQVGEWITPSPPLLTVPPVVDLIDPTSLYVSAPMDEVDSAKIHVEQAVKVTVDSHPGQVFPGRVVRLAPYVLDVEAQNRTLEIEVEFDDPKFAATLLPGTSADVEVVLDARERVLRIPTSALLEGDKVLVASNGTLEESVVEIGLKNWNYAEVRSGLQEGQLVVTSLDRVEVKAGARVAIENAAPTP